jgi:hypothetical protein
LKGNRIDIGNHDVFFFFGTIATSLGKNTACHKQGLPCGVAYF